MQSTADAAPPSLPAPYVGMRPYEPAEHHLLTGRSADARILTDKVFSARLTLFYALSGLGKSSVVKALVIPELERQECETLYLDAWSGTEPETELRQTLCKRLMLHGLGGAFGDSDPLAELVRLVTGDGRTLVLVLDQFEEFLLNHPQHLDPLRAELAALVNAPGLDLRILVTMREEFLANLEPFREKIVNLFQSTYRLEPLGSEAVREAIWKPAKDFQVDYEEALLDRLVADLEARGERLSKQPVALVPGLKGGRAAPASGRATQTADLPMLQVVCKELWEAAKPKQGETLTLKSYEKLGGAKHIMDFYVRKAMPGNWRDQLFSARLMKFLAPPSGLKISYTVSDLAAMSGLDAERIEYELRRLASKDVRILRIREFQGGERFELQHDALVPHIASWRNHVLAKHAWLKRLGRVVSGGVLMMVLLLFGAGQYFNWQNEQPWGSLTNFFDGRVDELSGDSISIGRSVGAIKNMIDVPDAQSHNVSRLHLFVSRDHLAVDARSLNGTTVNAQFLQYGYDRKLEDGDIIALAGAAVFQFRLVSPPLFPSPWHEERKSSSPAEGVWALLIDGKSRDAIPLTREEYFLSAGEQGAVTLGDKKDANSLLYIKKSSAGDSDAIVANLARDLFLTAMIKYEDRYYASIKMPGPPPKKVPQSLPKKTSQSLNEVLNSLPTGGGEYISKVTFCFSKTEQPRDAEQIDPDAYLSCDVGPLQIVLRRESGPPTGQRR